MPTISYRPWARQVHGLVPLHWICKALAKRYGNESFVITCHDERDFEIAQPIADEFGIFVALCSGQTRLQALGEASSIIPSNAVAYFGMEAILAPSPLLERMIGHHNSAGNHFTAIQDLPEALCPEIIDQALLLSLAAFDFAGSTPTPGEAVARLIRAQTEREAVRVRAERCTVRQWFGIPPAPLPDQLLTPEDLDRTRQAIALAPQQYTWEVLQHWYVAQFEPEAITIARRGLASGSQRVLHFVPGCFYAGAEECLRGLAQELTARGFEQVALIGAEGLLANRLREAGCEVIAADRNLLRPASAKGLQFAEQVLEAVRPSVIYGNGLVAPDWIAAAQGRRIEVLLHMRTAVFPEVDLIRKADRIITVSNFARDQMVEAGVSGERITVVYEGVDIDRFTPGCFSKLESRRHLGLPEEAFLIVMIARPTPSKRHDLLIGALADLRSADVDAHVAFVGDFGGSHYRHELRRCIHDLALTTHVTWLPFQQDIREIECAADTVVLPSDNEAIGFSTVEAMSLGIPVVVSTSGGGPELIDDGVSGLLMRGGNTRSLFEALFRLATNPELRARIGNNARRRTCERFSLADHADNIARILHESGRLHIEMK